MCAKNIQPVFFLHVLVSFSGKKIIELAKYFGSVFVKKILSTVQFHTTIKLISADWIMFSIYLRSQESLQSSYLKNLFFPSVYA